MGDGLLWETEAVSNHFSNVCQRNILVETFRRRNYLRSCWWLSCWSFCLINVTFNNSIIGTAALNTLKIDITFFSSLFCKRRCKNSSCTSEWRIGCWGGSFKSCRAWSLFFCRWSCRGCFLRSSWSSTSVILELFNIFFVVNDNGDHLSEFNILWSFWVQKFGNVTFLLHLKVNSGLVCFNLCKNITRLYRVTFLLQPLGNISLDSYRIRVLLPFPLLVKDSASQVSNELASWMILGLIGQ